MDFKARRLWMDNRLFPGRRGIRPEFEEGLQEFVVLAKTTEPFIRHGTIKCPCIKCKCCTLQDIMTVQLHLLDKGFMPDYYIWRYHGEPWDLQGHIQMLQNIHGTSSSPVLELDEYWQSPEFEAKSEQGKAARASEKGGSLHTGGSISAATQKMRLEKKEKRTIPVLELHKIRHTKGAKKGGGEWVEPRAKEVWEKATTAVKEWTSTQASDAGSSTPAPLTFEKEKQIWVDAVGGVKKGSAYGLGSLFASDKHKASFSGTSATSPPSSSIDPAEIAQMKEKIEQMARVNQETQDMIKQLLAKKQKKKSRRKHKSRR